MKHVIQSVHVQSSYWLKMVVLHNTGSQNKKSYLDVQYMFSNVQFPKFQ